MKDYILTQCSRWKKHILSLGLYTQQYSLPRFVHAKKGLSFFHLTTTTIEGFKITNYEAPS